MASSTIGASPAMAPALTKILKNGRGIHLSSPLASVRADQSKSASDNTELGPHAGWMEDGDLEKMWPNLSFFHFLNSCIPQKTLDQPVNNLFSPHPQTSDRHCKVDASNKGQTQSHPRNSAFPGVLGIFSVPVPEHNSQEACLLHEQRAASDSGPDGYNMSHSSLAHTSVFPSNSLWEINSQGCTPLLVTPASLTHAKITAMGHPPPPPPPPPPEGQTWPGRVAIDHLPSKAVQQEEVKKQLSRQAGLHERARLLQRRLQLLLGEHTVKHCSQQLEGLKEHCQREKVLPDRLSHAQASETSRNSPFSRLKLPNASCLDQEVREFSNCSQVLIQGLQEVLDSEATVSSSSDEELDDVKIHGKTSLNSHINALESQWLEERAELASSWSWLQLRLTELDGKIQKLVGICKIVRSKKRGVVLADYKPLIPIQQSDNKECPGLSFTDDPCSPAWLLRNIEKQSAELQQIVNSLMPPFSFSPFSKQTDTSWKGNQTSKRARVKRDLFGSGSYKKKTLMSRRSFKVDLSFTCARTRPLVFYQKSKMFIFNPRNANKLHDSGDRSANLSSCPSSSSRLCCSWCDHVVVSPDHNFSSTILSSSSCSSCSSKPPPLPSLSFDEPWRVVGREQWFLRPLMVSSRPTSPAKHQRPSSTPHNSHKRRQCVKHRKKVMNVLPIGSAGSQHGRASQKKRTRRHIPRAMVEFTDKDSSSLLYDLQESFDETFEESQAQILLKPSGKGIVRKRQEESVFNINSVLLPVSQTKVEKLQCKNISTPSWRVNETNPLNNNITEEEMDEDLSDKAFIQRHIPLELKEKLLWSSWGRRKGCRRPTGSGSRMSVCGDGMWTSGEEGCVDRSAFQLDVYKQLPLEEEEWRPQTPWESRAFPLDIKEEANLFSDV